MVLLNTRNWKDTGYLATGTERQREAYTCLRTLAILEDLHRFDATLVGTIPLDIDLPESDLDIICYAEDLDDFDCVIFKKYGALKDFVQARSNVRGVPTTTANFLYRGFVFEVFAQAVMVNEQNAYLHMLIEAVLLERGGGEVKTAIRELKASGLKTEPAFARYFNLTGDPYDLLRQMALSEIQG